MLWHASNSRGQLKIQEMAFVLVAIFVFFGVAALFFITVNLGDVRQDVQDLGREQARQMAYQIANDPEFSWHDESCDGCIDLLKALLVKQDRAIYLPMWNIDYLAIEIISNKTGECTLSNFPECSTVTLANRTTYYGIPASAFVSICYHSPAAGGGSYEKCEMGKIYSSNTLEVKS